MASSGAAPGSVVGIDLGTTNTVIAVDGKVLRQRTADLAAGVTQAMPSVVAYPPTGEILVGAPARKRRAIDPQNTIMSAKRIIGQRWHSSAAKEFRRRYPFELSEDAEGFTVFITRAGHVGPTGVAAHVIRTAASNAGVDLKGQVGVIAVPSLFRDAQLLATIDAGLAAGLADVAIVREPAATAAAYLGLASDAKARQVDAGVKRAAVFDLGGGTFDLAVVDCTTDPFTVLSHGGDLFCGGDDLDMALAKHVAQAVLQEHGWDLQADTASWSRLVLACEQAKIALMDTPTAAIDLAEVDPAGPFAGKHYSLTEAKLSELAEALVRRTFIICDEVLMKVGMKARDLDAVFLAGGATNLRVVREGVSAYFGRSGLCLLDPMSVVAQGASMLGCHDAAQRLLRRSAVPTP